MSSFNHHRLKAVLELTGPAGCGKTTLAELLIHLLAPAEEILIIDASVDEGFAKRWAGKRSLTLQGILESFAAKQPLLNEQIDYIFAESVSTIGEGVDLLTLGALNSALPETEHLLSYGLSRFLQKNYTFAVVDGYHPLIHQFLPVFKQIVFVYTPDTIAFLSQDGILDQSPSNCELILNKAGEGSILPPAIEPFITEKNIRFVGKIPAYLSYEEMLKKMPQTFSNCLLKMNLPVQMKWLEQPSPLEHATDETSEPL